jgi:hypothetical protein
MLASASPVLASALLVLASAVWVLVKLTKSKKFALRAILNVLLVVVSVSLVLASALLVLASTFVVPVSARKMNQIGICRLALHMQPFWRCQRQTEGIVGPRAIKCVKPAKGRYSRKHPQSIQLIIWEIIFHVRDLVNNKMQSNLVF